MSGGFRAVRIIVLCVMYMHVTCVYIMCHTLNFTKRIPREQRNSYMATKKRRLHRNAWEVPL